MRRGLSALATLYQTLDEKQETVWTARDRMVQTAASMRSNLRRYQYGYALTSYLKLKPNDAMAQWELGEYFLRENCYDLAVDHMRICAEILENLKDAKVNIAAINKKLKGWSDYVGDALRDLESQAFQSEMDKVHAHLKVGLAKRAGEILDEATPKLSERDSLLAAQLAR